MVARAALLLALVAAPALAADSQWMLTQQRVGESLRPVAVFLDWNHGNVVFRASCDAAASTLVVRHYVGSWEIRQGHAPMALLRGSARLPLTTVLADGGLEGRLVLSPSVLAALSAPGDLRIAAPTALFDPWPVGRADPLVRIAELCLAQSPSGAP